jgi:transposase
MSDYKGAALMFDALPDARAMIADKGYDGDWFRQALAARGTTPCIPSKSNRKVAIPHDAVLYRQRHLIENMFGKLKTGAASTPATTVAPTPSSQPSPSPLPSSSGLVGNES